VVLGDDLVDLLLGVLGIGGELGGDVAQDCELLGQFYGNANEGAIGAEELVDLLRHGSIFLSCKKQFFIAKSECFSIEKPTCRT